MFANIKLGALLGRVIAMGTPPCNASDVVVVAMNLVGEKSINVCARDGNRRSGWLNVIILLGFDRCVCARWMLGCAWGGGGGGGAASSEAERIGLPPYHAAQAEES